MVIVVPQGTVTAASESTAHDWAVRAVPPLRVTPAPVGFSATTQPGAADLISA